MPKVSICVPVYNVEKTLHLCIDAILSQTFKDYEVILVDDGSTDRSGQMCDDYAVKYPNFKVIHKENEGLGPTRDRGLDESCGEYIYHCDSDDWFEPEMLENLVSAIETNHADVVIFGYHLLTEEADGTYKTYGYTRVPNGVYEGEDVCKFYVENYFNSFSVLSACNRLCRRSFLIDNKIRFPKLRRGQDVAYSLLLFEKINKLVTLNNAYYNYVIQPGVFKGRAFDEMINIYLQIHRMSCETFERWNLYDNFLKQKVINHTCESIANYCSYAFIKKYPDQYKQNAKILLNNRTICDLFSQYKRTSSKFMLVFKWAVKLRSKILLYKICVLAQQKSKNEINS